MPRNRNAKVEGAMIRLEQRGAVAFTCMGIASRTSRLLPKKKPRRSGAKWVMLLALAGGRPAISLMLA